MSSILSGGRPGADYEVVGTLDSRCPLLSSRLSSSPAPSSPTPPSLGYGTSLAQRSSLEPTVSPLSRLPISP